MGNHASNLFNFLLLPVKAINRINYFTDLHDKGNLRTDNLQNNFCDSGFSNPVRGAIFRLLLVVAASKIDVSFAVVVIYPAYHGMLAISTIDFAGKQMHGRFTRG